jgi:hypothetical protein
VPNISVAKADSRMTSAPQIAIPEPSPTPGEPTTGLRFLNYSPKSDGTYLLSLEGLGGKSYTISACSQRALRATGATLNTRSRCWSDLTVSFSGKGYQRAAVTLRMK